jgi:CubicO group peptidase (beta-lactamase class C family)
MKTIKRIAYLSEFACTGAGQVTLHDLLTHTSELPDYILEIPGYMDYQPPNLSADSAMAFVLDLSLEFRPGEGYAYSNTGYVLLGMIIERLSGKSYARVLEERIFHLGFGSFAMLQRQIEGEEVVILWNNNGGLPPVMPEIMAVLVGKP